jgi:hypothetical protein
MDGGRRRNSEQKKKTKSIGTIDLCGWNMLLKNLKCEIPPNLQSICIDDAKKQSLKFMPI